MQWYYSSNGSQQGPVSEEELKVMITQGKVDSGDLVWRDGMPDWLPLSKVPELSASASEASPSTPTSPAPAPPAQASPYQSPQSDPVIPSGSAVVPGIPPEGSGKATASMVMGICGLVFCCIPCVGLILGILATVYGGQILEAVKIRPELLPFEGKAKAGRIMGIIAIVLSVLNMIGGVILRMNGGMDQFGN